MLTVKNKDISDEKYYSLVLYALLRCDAFTLRIQDPYTKISSNERSKEYFDYINSINRHLEKINSLVIKEYTDSNYLGDRGGNYSVTKVMPLTEDALGFLMASGGLFNWIAPERPEDLCFLSKGKCWMKSIAHEKICKIFTTNDIEKDIIKKVIKLKYFENEDIDAPTLDY